MKTKSLFLALILAMSLCLYSVGLDTVWSVKGGEVDWLPETGDLTRGAAYNPDTGNILVVSRDTEEVVIVSAVDGSEVGTLAEPAGGYEDGTFVINAVTVTPSGVIIVSNLDVDDSDDPIKFYIWENEADGSPQVMEIAMETRAGEYVTAVEDAQGNITALSGPSTGNREEIIMARLTYDAGTASWATDTFSIFPPDLSDPEDPEADPDYPAFFSFYLNEDGTSYGKRTTRNIFYFDDNGEYVETGNVHYGNRRATLISPFTDDGLIAATNVHFQELDAAGYPGAAIDTWMWIWNADEEIIAYKNIQDLLTERNGNYAGAIEIFEQNDEIYVMSMVTNNFLAVFQYDPSAEEPQPAPLIYHDFEPGYIRTAEQLGFTDSYENLHICGVAYNPVTDRILVADAKKTSDLQPGDTASIAIIDRETGNNVGMIEDISMNYEQFNMIPRRIHVTDDGVLLLMGEVGCIYQTSDQVSSFDGAYRMFSRWAYDPEEYGYGLSHGMSAVGSLNSGELYILSTMGNRIYVWKNSPQDITRFAMIDLIYFRLPGDESTAHPFVHGVKANSDLTEIYAYAPRVSGTAYDSHPALRRYYGSPDTGYTHDEDFASQWGWEQSLCGDIDGDFLVMSRAHSDGTNIFTRIMFQSISTQAGVFSGNEGAGHFVVEDTPMANRYGGVVTDSWHGEVYAVNSYGLFQMIGDVDTDEIPTSVIQWSLFE